MSSILSQIDLYLTGRRDETKRIVKQTEMIIKLHRCLYNYVLLLI